MKGRASIVGIDLTLRQFAAFAIVRDPIPFVTHSTTHPIMAAKKSGMRRGLTAYGDEDFSLFLRKAFIKAMGYTDDALERPIIGITNTFSGFNACHRNVPELIEAVKRGVMLAGGLPVEFPVITLHESFAFPTSMYLRNMMAMDTEEMIRAQPVDAIGADRRLRQDGARVVDGRRERERSRDHAGDGPHAHRQPRGERARRVHRLPPLLGALSRGRNRPAGNQRGQRKARADRGHVHGDGHREHDGAVHRSNGHDVAGRRRDSRGDGRPHPQCRGDRRRAPSRSPKKSSRRRKS